jgi:hypothetical protein
MKTAVMSEKQPTSYRLSDEAKAIVARLSALYGVKAAGILEIAVRVLDRAGLPGGSPPIPEDLDAARKRGRRGRPPKS